MGFLSQIKDAVALRNEQKKIEREMAKIVAEYSNGGITATARGDLTIVKIEATPEAYEEVKAGKPARFETMLTNVVNGALKRVREIGQEKMMQILNKNGLGDLLGK